MSGTGSFMTPVCAVQIQNVLFSNTRNWRCHHTEFYQQKPPAGGASRTPAQAMYMSIELFQSSISNAKACKIKPPLPNRWLWNSLGSVHNLSWTSEVQKVWSCSSWVPFTFLWCLAHTMFSEKKQGCLLASKPRCHAQVTWACRLVGGSPSDLQATLLSWCRA